jgi:hypothetical protein
MGALRDDGESPRRRKRYASGGCGEDYAGGKGGEGERPVQTRLSNFHHYAVTGVKAQAFVLVLFHQSATYRNLYQ